MLDQLENTTTVSVNIIKICNISLVKKYIIEACTLIETMIKCNNHAVCRTGLGVVVLIFYLYYVCMSGTVNHPSHFFPYKEKIQRKQCDLAKSANCS